MPPEIIVNKRSPKHLSVPVPATAAAQMGSNISGLAIASILGDQLLGAKPLRLPSQVGGWESVLGKNRLAPPQRGRTRLKFVCGASAPTTFPAAATGGSEPGPAHRPVPQQPAGEAARIIGALEEYRSIVNAPMPTIPQYVPIVVNMRRLVPIVFRYAVRLLSNVEKLLCAQIGLGDIELAERCQAAAAFSEAIAHGKMAQPADLCSTAKLLGHFGIVTDQRPVDLSGIGAGSQRLSVPLTPGLRKVLEQLSDRTGLGMGAIGAAALLAHYTQTPLRDLLSRYSERRVLIRLGKQLVELDALLRSYHTRLSARLSPRADRALPDFVQSIRRGIPSLPPKNRHLLRVVAGCLTGRAETDLAALSWRSSQLQPFCQQALRQPERLDSQTIEKAAGLIQRLWSRHPEVTSVYRQMVSARWTDLTTPFTE
jgi:hypothetical protein